MAYTIEGLTSTGETFHLGVGNGPYFEDHDDAVTYALEYARSVTNTLCPPARTSRVVIERLPDRTVVTVQGEDYGERLTIAL